MALNKTAFYKYAQIIFAIAISIVIVLYFGVYLVENPKRGGYGKSDFSVLYMAGAAITGERGMSVEKLYDRTLFESKVKELRGGSGGTKYLYPLPSLFFFAPWTVIAFSIAWKVWALLGIVSFIAAYYGVVFFLVKDSVVYRFRYTFILLALAASPVVNGELYSGQVNSLLFFMLVLGIAASLIRREKLTRVSGVFVRNGADVIAGVLFGFVAIVKWFSIALIPALVIRKQWIVLGSFIVTMMLSIGLTLVWFTPYQLQRGITGVHDQPIQRGSVGYTRDSSTFYGSLRASMYQKNSWFGVSITEEWQQKQLYDQSKLAVRIFAALSAVVIALLYIRSRKTWGKAPWVIDMSVAFSFLFFFAESTHDQYHFFLIPFCLWLLSFWGATRKMSFQYYNQWQWVSGLLGILLIIALFFSSKIVPHPYWTIMALKPSTMAIGIILLLASWFRFSKKGQLFWVAQKES